MKKQFNDHWERGTGYKEAFKYFEKAAENVVTGAEFALNQSIESRGKVFKKHLTGEQVRNVVDFQPISGRSIAQWFSKLKKDDLDRIVQGVQRASVEGMSVDKVSAMIMGTKANNYDDGILQTSRKSAQMMARTVINGVSNNAMMETCFANADVIDGIEFDATLDAKTCPFCGSLDGKIWKEDDYQHIRRPPLHANCRCVVIPYIDMGEDLDGQRPAANADFDKLAEEEYNNNARKNGWKRRWKDLSPSTRQKYYYQAQKDFEARTGKPAYRLVSGKTTFKEYFESQPEEFQRSWLGPERYAIYKTGKIGLDVMVSPSTGYKYPAQKLHEKIYKNSSKTVYKNEKTVYNSVRQQASVADSDVAFDEEAFNKRLEELAKKPELPVDFEKARESVRTPLFNDTSKMEEYLKKRFGVDADFKEYQKKLAQAFTEELDAVCSLMMGNSDFIRSVGVITDKEHNDSAGLYWPTDRRIEMKKGLTKKKMEKMRLSAKKAGFNATDNWMGTIRHEIGHAIETYITEMSGKSTEILQEIEDICAEIPEWKRSQTLSIYGLDDSNNTNGNYTRAREAIAEAFSLYLGGEYNKFGMRIINVLWKGVQ